VEVIGPTQRYLQDARRGLITTDQNQLAVVARLQQLHEQLLAEQQASPTSWSRLRAFLGGDANNDTAVRGIYLWGGVGRGKTYLMDLFYDCLPMTNKSRTHFHRFMQRVHQDLVSLQGHKNPLQAVAAGIAEEARILCFDEFFVLDIGDAMILAGLLQALAESGVILVATSNVKPDDLYSNGLQRERFIPAITLLKDSVDVIELVSPTDYRLRNLQQAALYYHPINSHTEELLQKRFYDLAPDPQEIKVDAIITILNRQLKARCYCGDVAWFEFAELCAGPRSAFDYVELARLFHALIVSSVPILDEARNDQARRFISLVDELYDRRVKLILAAATPLEALYQGHGVAFEFERTRSRLIEMQSVDYLGSGHRA
jgi:cell division protein ZapE